MPNGSPFRGWDYLKNHDPTGGDEYLQHAYSYAGKTPTQKCLLRIRKEVPCMYTWAYVRI